MTKFSWFIFSFSPSCVFVVCPGLCSALDESVDWRPFGLPFALVLGHACPVVFLSHVLFVCIVCNSVLGWGSIPRRVWPVGTPPFEMEPSLTE